MVQHVLPLFWYMPRNRNQNETNRMRIHWTVKILRKCLRVNWFCCIPMFFCWILNFDHFSWMHVRMHYFLHAYPLPNSFWLHCPLLSCAYVCTSTFPLTFNFMLLFPSISQLVRNFSRTDKQAVFYDSSKLYTFCFCVRHLCINACFKEFHTFFFVIILSFRRFSLHRVWVCIYLFRNWMLLSYW